MSEQADRKAERAHGGIASRTGNLVTLGDGNQWWLNGTAWARNEADALMPRDRALVEQTRQTMRMNRT